MNMKSVGLPFQVDGLREEPIMTYYKPLILQLRFEIEFDWQHIDEFSEVLIIV